MISINHKIFCVVVAFCQKAISNLKENAMKIYMYMHTNKDNLLLTEPRNNNGFKSIQKWNTICLSLIKMPAENLNDVCFWQRNHKHTFCQERSIGWHNNLEWEKNICNIYTNMNIKCWTECNWESSIHCFLTCIKPNKTTCTFQVVGWPINMVIKSHYILQKETFNTSKKKKVKSKRYYMYLAYRRTVGFCWQTLWFSSGSSKYDDETNYSQEEIGLGQ